MELFPLAPSQGSRTCARWPLCLALGVVRRRMYLAAVASPTERPLRVVHPFLVPQCLKEPGLPSPDKLREYANVGSFRWSVLGRGMFIHASASGTRLQQNAHLRRVFLKKEEFTRRFESVISSNLSNNPPGGDELAASSSDMRRRGSNGCTARSTQSRRL